jgi:hypothetical protein
MPKKSLQSRERRAKAKGVPAKLSDVDLGTTDAASAHAAKKSRHLSLDEYPADRRVSKMRAPGTGKRTVPTRPAAAARAYKRSEAGSAQKPGHVRKEQR